MVQISQLVILSSAIAHALAWVVYLPLAVGLAVWPALQGGLGEEQKVLVTLFMPVALTGLGLLVVLINGLQGACNKSPFLALAALLLVFCGLGIFSISQLHLPLELKLAAGIVIGSFSIILVVDAGNLGVALSLWGVGLLLMGFCVLAMFSVGIFYLPAALALLVAAAASLLRRPFPTPAIRFR